MRYAMLHKSDASPDSEAGDTDLPVDVQIELLALQQPGRAISHYEVLGLDATADPIAIRSAYLARSKRFHPDAWYGKKLAQFGPLLADTFRRVSEAHAVLSEAESRATYDASRTSGVSAKERTAVTARAEVRAEEDRRADERRRRVFHTKGFARLGAARKLFEDAQALEERGERGLALQALKAARDLDPTRKEIAARLGELELLAVKSRAQQMLARARAEEQQGDASAALVSYQAAMRHDPASVTALLGAARAAVHEHDFANAAAWAAKAVEYAPKAAEGRLLLARAQIGLSQKALAKATLAQLLAQHPDQKEARALLKSL